MIYLLVAVTAREGIEVKKLCQTGFCGVTGTYKPVYQGMTAFKVDDFTIKRISLFLTKREIYVSVQGYSIINKCSVNTEFTCANINSLSSLCMDFLSESCPKRTSELTQSILKEAFKQEPIKRLPFSSCSLENVIMQLSS
jgi:hypothetical protein